MDSGSSDFNHDVEMTCEFDEQDEFVSVWWSFF